MWSRNIPGVIQKPPEMSSVLTQEVNAAVCTTSDWTVRCRVAFSGIFGNAYELYIEVKVDQGSYVHLETVQPTSSPYLSATTSDAGWQGIGTGGAGGPAPTLYAQHRCTVRLAGGGATKDGPDETAEQSESGLDYCDA